MLQSGMLIPVHERSETFYSIEYFTDIGDNQSIENPSGARKNATKTPTTFLSR
jgi:DNA mismatch repair protein MutS2